MVKPAMSVRRACSVASMARCAISFLKSSSSSRFQSSVASPDRCVCASMRPGRSVTSPRSITSAPAGGCALAPTAVILLPSTTTMPGATTASLLPSKRRAAREDDRLGDGGRSGERDEERDGRVRACVHCTFDGRGRDNGAVPPSPSDSPHPPRRRLFRRASSSSSGSSLGIVAGAIVWRAWRRGAPSCSGRSRTLFLRLIKMIVAPLIFASLVAGIAGARRTAAASAAWACAPSSTSRS